MIRWKRGLVEWSILTAFAMFVGTLVFALFFGCAMTPSDTTAALDAATTEVMKQREALGQDPEAVLSWQELTTSGVITGVGLWILNYIRNRKYKKHPT